MNYLTMLEIADMFADSLDFGNITANSIDGTQNKTIGIYQRGIACHSPPEAQLMCVSHNVKKLTSEKRLSACDTEHWLRVKVTGDLVKELIVGLDRHFLALNITAAASAVQAVLVAPERQLQKKPSELRLMS